MNIFVTGATGFLGKSITRRLISHGHSVTALVLPDDPGALSDGVSVVNGDITRPETLRGKMKDHDAVVHLAGSVGYGQTWERCIRLNRDGTQHVARAAIESGLRRFVHLSSVAVYGRVANVPITEDFLLKKIGDPYGDTKIDAEQFLTDLSREDKLDLTIIRPTVIYGPGDLLFLPKLMENLANRKARIIGSGENRVDLIHVSDAAGFVALVLEKEKAIGRVYNLNHPDNPAWKEMISAVAEAMGVPVPDRHLPYWTAIMVSAIMEGMSKFTRKPPRLTRYAARVVGREYIYVTDRMTSELGFKPAVDLIKGIRECVTQAMAEGDSI